MKNRNVGYLIMGISLVIVAIVLLFNSGLKDIVGDTCSHGPTCTMYDTIGLQTGLSLIIAGLVFLIGVFFVFTKQDEKIVVKRVNVKQRRKKPSLSGLDVVERKAVDLLLKEGGMFQKSLMESLDVGKVKMTRLLDKLEAKQIIERKRRGMNNFVVLKS